MMYGTQILMESNRKAAQDPRYVATMRNRPVRKHRVFEIGNGVFFEFWSPREWEFTVLPLEIDLKSCSRLMNQLYTDASCIGPSADSLPRIVKKARQTVAAYLAGTPA